MITHVAEAGEDRGRVLLTLGSSGRLSDVALEAAVRLAQAFHSELESLFVEDLQLYDLARFTFARETSRSGRTTRALLPSVIERDVQLQAAALGRRVLVAATLLDVRARARVVRDEPARALAKACAEKGPWNVVTLGEPFGATDEGALSELFQTVDATTGFVITGPKARRTKGPVVALVEEVERLPSMLRAAERLASVTGGEPRIWLLEDGPDRLAWLDGQIRLSLGLKAAAIKLEAYDMMRSDIGALAASLRQHEAGFVIARIGGRLASADEGSVPIAALLEGPLFLAR
ncbi:MAG: hypothetical protein WC807_17500 [Hyphomicrobium sp.]|jgi:hypothetical protein